MNFEISLSFSATKYASIASFTCFIEIHSWPDGSLISLQDHSTVTMSTTIQVQDDVYKILNMLKKELNAESYNDVIKHLLKKTKRMDESEFGSMPGIAPFQREEIDRFD
jgi:predicted CopG family antitoxin